MAFKRYDPAKKAAFMKAATDARRAGKTWPQAHAAAKAAGYTGKRKSLENLIRKEQAAKSKRAPAASAKAAKPPTGAKAPAIDANDYASVQRMIDQIVRKKLSAAVENAVAALRKAVQ